MNCWFWVIQFIQMRPLLIRIITGRCHGRRLAPQKGIFVGWI